MKLLAFFLIVSTRADIPCLQSTTASGPYCVCNATHCDSVPPLLNLTYSEYQLYSSSKENLGFQSTQGKFSNVTLANEVLVSLKTHYQKILGFGGAFTDSTGINIDSLSNKCQSLLLESYFGSTGIGYSVGRVPIGGTDFSLKGYSYCDKQDDSLDSFALQEEDFKYKVPLIQRALELRGGGNLKLFASAWSAPVWMKNTDKYNGFGKVVPKYYQLWAKYYLKFFEEYEKQGVAFWGVTSQNEPIDGLIGTTVPNNGFDSEEMKNWIKEALGPAIRNSTFKNLKIILHDDQRLLLPLLKTLVLTDEEVVKYADGVGVHFYTDFFVPGSFLDLVEVEGKSLFRLATEGCAGSAHIFGLTEAVDLGSWSRAETYLSSIFTDLKHDVIGWVDWNMALNRSGGPNWIRNEVDSPIIVDSEKDEFYKQPMFYALGHFSKFVVPGSVRIGSESVLSDLEVLSFLRPDGKIVVVLWNKSNEAKSVNLAVDNLAGNLNLPAKSINTLLLSLYK
ncbi:unnamed protein product [Ceutorhynchus assimilis]|uniref:Glucosylceramidase n=1 Tax=Ceutorhynchus assimilis TaxID=467358 RepID=A0A9N9ML24_9CUCU|nr:unnamed protein product [Ceutorhynchus assimilis]